MCDINIIEMYLHIFDNDTTFYPLSLNLMEPFSHCNNFLKTYSIKTTTKPHLFDVITRTRNSNIILLIADEHINLTLWSKHFLTRSYSVMTYEKSVAFIL